MQTVKYVEKAWLDDRLSPPRTVLVLLLLVVLQQSLLRNLRAQLTKQIQ